MISDEAGMDISRKRATKIVGNVEVDVFETR